MKGKNKRYKRKRGTSEQVLFTLKLILTVLLACAITYMAFVIIFKGWQTIVDWFNGKWFAFACLIALVIVTAGVWIISLYMRVKRFEEDSKDGK
jgi:succinate dehydrogenase hydrophobic anchor subunit